MTLVRTRAWRLLVCVCLVFGMPLGGVRSAFAGDFATSADLAGPAQYVPGEVLVGWLPDAELDIESAPDDMAGAAASPARARATQLLAERSGLKALDVHLPERRARLAVARGREWDEISRLRKLPWVQFAEPNYLAFAAGLPNDPFLTAQWNMLRVGALAAFDAPPAAYTPIVAVLDSGVDLGHPEFGNRLLTGYDYVNGDNQPYDDFGHGTFVTGIIAAGANDGIGVIGLAPRVSILPLKVLGSQGTGTFDDIAQAIRDAVDGSAQVINLSLGAFLSEYEGSETLRSAIGYAQQHNTLIVAAAGNCTILTDDCSPGGPDFYPAAYADAQRYPDIARGVLAVSASSRLDNWVSYSNHRSWVSLAAPGGENQAGDNILSAYPRAQSSSVPGYAYMTGTSVAAPHVSAAAALAWSYMPAASFDWIAQILKDSGDRVGGFAYDPLTQRNDYFGNGRLNVERALRQAYPPALSLPQDSMVFPLGGPRLPQTARLQLNNCSEQPATWQAAVVAGAPWLSISPLTVSAATYSAPGILTVRAAAVDVPPGEYSGAIQVRQIYPSGQVFTVSVSLRVPETVYYSFSPVLQR